MATAIQLWRQDFFALFCNSVKFPFFFSDYPQCALSSTDYRYNEQLVAKKSLDNEKLCAIACKLIETCKYWSYRFTSKQCSMIPSGGLDMTQDIVDNGDGRRGDTTCHPPFCVGPKFENMEIPSDDSSKIIYNKGEEIE